MGTKYKQYVNARERLFCNSYDLGPDMTGIPAIIWISSKTAYKKELPLRFTLVENLGNLERYDLSTASTIFLTNENNATTVSDLPARKPACWKQVELFVQKNANVLLGVWNGHFFDECYAEYSEYDVLKENLK